MQEHDLLTALGFIALGLGTGAFGTLIGAGGGFILMPVLLMLFPHDDPALLTAISLAVVFANAASGTEAYAVMKRVDYASGWRFALAATPGAVLGALSTHAFPRRAFDVLFGALLVAGALYLLLRRQLESKGKEACPPNAAHRHLVDSSGETYDYCFNMKTGLRISVGVGFLSSLLGIGGGIIHVPAMVCVLGFPVHVATATSHFVLACMALAGTLTHVFTGSFHEGVQRTIYLAIGVLAGAQVGAHLSRRINAAWIMKSLAVALALAGLRILMQGAGAG
ncbi:sulfite exporter TauE/SafE family protein [Fundidesulfovibrio soli]|uniref:sulfite exporter TauE/SafE family protein n=1 Tax=Fundidesulfovibrio soli TaxID=2922716 RepID=UPI001FAEC5F6|nr:sulfite exporter TauE/SafE family protein [Fundidesulfovibrio soli]